MLLVVCGHFGRCRIIVLTVSSVLIITRLLSRVTFWTKGVVMFVGFLVGRGIKSAAFVSCFHCFLDQHKLCLSIAMENVRRMEPNL